MNLKNWGIDKFGSIGGYYQYENTSTLKMMRKLKQYYILILQKSFEAYALRHASKQGVKFLP